MEIANVPGKITKIHFLDQQGVQGCKNDFEIISLG